MRLSGYALSVLVPLLGATAAGGAGAQTLAPHRAVYDLALADAGDDSDIMQLAGRWVFEFSGSACQGYTLNSRIVMRFEMSDGPSTIDQRVSSFEDAKGETFRFSTKSFIDQEFDSEVTGVARLEPSGTVIDYDAPEDVEHSFASTKFPTAQLRELLQKAKAGERFYETVIFDGTEFTDEPVLVSMVVGSPKPVEKDDLERDALGVLAQDTFRPVTAAYFDGEGADGEETSDYNVSFKLHENGVQRDMLIRYENYSMTARLSELTILDNDEKCEAETRG